MEWICLKKQSTFVNKTINSWRRYSFLHFDLICCTAFKIVSSMFTSDHYGYLRNFWEISQNLLENTSVRVSFLIKLQIEACNFIQKETLAQALVVLRGGWSARGTAPGPALLVTRQGASHLRKKLKTETWIFRLSAE